MEDALPVHSEMITSSTNGTLTGQIDIAEEKPVSSQRSGLKQGIFAHMRAGMKVYGAALVGTAAYIPLIASALTSGFYFAPPASLLPEPLYGWHPIVYGGLVAVGLCLVASIFFYHFTTAKGVNNRGYDTLINSKNQLKAQLDVIESQHHNITWSFNQQVALREARDGYNALIKKLSESSAGLQWVLGTGYIDVWSTFHRAEEAMIEVEPVEMVIRGALHDKLAIQDSKMAHEVELLIKLRRAVICLDEAMNVHFRRGREEEDEFEIRKLRLQLDRIAKKVGIDLEDNQVFGSDTSALMDDTNQEAMARATIREVRHTLNEFRDGLWEGLVRSRNHLMATIFVTGLVTHLLLCIAILTSAPKAPSMLAAASFYIIGAIAGLFGRIRRESINHNATNDYGLSIARLVATPPLSGLAGIGGVLIYSTLLNGHNMMTSFIADFVFVLNRPDYFLVAAIFGLAPNLITRSLQERSERYFSALNRSKGAEVDLSDDGS